MNNYPDNFSDRAFARAMGEGPEPEINPDLTELEESLLRALQRALKELTPNSEAYSMIEAAINLCYIQEE